MRTAASCFASRRDTTTATCGRSLRGAGRKVRRWDAARRETEEETGVIAEIIEPIRDQFEGGTTINEYFLMRPTGQAHEPRNETDSVLWAGTPDKAREMINETTNIPGRNRDLKVLKAALALRDDLR